MIPQTVQALTFDYGNTIIPFGARQVAACDRAFADALRHLYGPVAHGLLEDRGTYDRAAPYAGPEYRERTWTEMTEATVRELYNRNPALREREWLVHARFDAFVKSVLVEPGTIAALETLGRRYRLALLSNYPDGSAIRESLRKTGLDAFFNPVIVSADIGRVKPHPLMFRTLLDQLGMPAPQVAFIGDNWLADVQGAKRAGLFSVWFRRWEPPEPMPLHASDLPPDLSVNSLEELLQLIPEKKT